MNNDVVLFIAGVAFLILIRVFSAWTEMGTKLPWKRRSERVILSNQTTIKDQLARAMIVSIIKIIVIKKYTLAIYYTSADCYKYAIIDDYGTVYEPDDIFYTSE